MKNLIKVLGMSFLIAFTAATAYSQQAVAVSDTIKTVRSAGGDEQQVRNQEKNQNQNQNQAQAGNQGDSKGQVNSQNAAKGNQIKKVNSAKPDWSKAKGARPNIVRPAGSGIPKGAGKPGGAGKFRGGR